MFQINQNDFNSAVKTALEANSNLLVEMLREAFQNKPLSTTSAGETLSASEVKAMLRITSDTTLWSYIRESIIPPPQRIGRKRIWYRADIEQVLNRQIGNSKKGVRNGR